MRHGRLRGQTALVTGASSGIGQEIARELAHLGCDLILAARREDRLRDFQAQIERDYGTEVQVFPLDLALEDSREELYRQTAGAGRRVDILVNNAGFAIYDEYHDISWQRERQLLDINVIALTHLTRLFLPHLLEQRQGYILLVASVMGYAPVPPYTTYAASKAYVVSYAHSLRFELRGSGVSVTVTAPGTTESEFLKVSGQHPSRYERMYNMRAKDVARISVSAMLRRRATVIPGWLNALTVFSTRLLPRTWLAFLTDWLMKMD